MKRRFTDIEKWAPWFRRLPPDHKLFWIFIHDNCDEVGVWIIDIEKAEFYTGCKYNIREVEKAFAGKIAILNGAWWIVHYVELQYKELRLPTKEELAQNPNLKHSPAPRYLKLLESHGLLEAYFKQLEDNKLQSLELPVNPQLTPSQPTPNSPEEEEEKEEEVFNGGKKSKNSLDQDATSQNVSVDGQEIESIDNKFEDFLQSAEAKEITRDTPYDPTH